MKCILSVLLGVSVLTSSVSAQTMQASIGQGSAGSRVIIYLKPDLAVNGNISTLQYDIAIPAGIVPIPTMSIVGTPAIGSGWIIQPSYVEDGFRHYEILTGNSFTVTIGAGVETAAMELQFTGGPVSANNVSLVTLPFGGSNTGNALFLCTGAANSVEGSLYYPRSGVSVINNLTYTGGAASSATVGGILLPVKWLSFDVVKQQNDGLVSWSVENEENNNFYEVQRSLNGVDFVTISTVNKSGTGSGIHQYTYTDLNLARNNSSVLYYRLKQVGMDSRISYSDIRTLRLDLSADINVYPNPVKKGFYVSMPFTNPDNRLVKLDLISNAGQIVQSRQVTTSQARNYYFDISQLKLAAGQYQLRIFFEGQVLDSRKLLINQE